MNEIIGRLRSFSKKDRFVKLAVLCAAVLLLAVSGLVTDAGKTKTDDECSERSTADDYIRNTRRDLEKFLEKIKGAGDVEVMLTVDSCYENIYAKEYKSKSESEGEKLNEQSESEYVTVKKGSNNEECLIEKICEPEIKGVAVIAEGADSAEVRKALTEAVCSVFGISSARVSVSTMKKE